MLGRKRCMQCWATRHENPDSECTHCLCQVRERSPSKSSSLSLPERVRGFAAAGLRFLHRAVRRRADMRSSARRRRKAAMPLVSAARDQKAERVPTTTTIAPPCRRDLPSRETTVAVMPARSAGRWPGTGRNGDDAAAGASNRRKCECSRGVPSLPRSSARVSSIEPHDRHGNRHGMFIDDERSRRRADRRREREGRDGRGLQQGKRQKCDWQR